MGQHHSISVLLFIIIALNQATNCSLEQNGKITSLINFGNGTQNQNPQNLTGTTNSNKSKNTDGMSNEHEKNDVEGLKILEDSLKLKNIQPIVISTTTAPIITENSSSEKNLEELDSLQQDSQSTTVVSPPAQKNESGRRRKLKKTKKNRQRGNRKPVMYGSEVFSEEEMGDIFNNFDQSAPDSFNYSLNTLFETDRLIEELELHATKEERFRIIKMIEEVDLDGLKQLRDLAKKPTTTTHSPVPPILTTLINQMETIEQEIGELSEKSRELQLDKVPSTLVEKTSPHTTEEPVDVEKNSLPSNTIIWTNIKTIGALSISALVLGIILFAVVFKLMRKMKNNEANEAN